MSTLTYWGPIKKYAYFLDLFEFKNPKFIKNFSLDLYKHTNIYLWNNNPMEGFIIKIKKENKTEKQKLMKKWKWKWKWK
jgi:hypothetical protein